MTERATLTTADDNPGPTIEESYEQMVKDGVIQDENADNSNPGDEAQAAEAGSQGDDAGADDSTEDRPSWLPEKFKSPEDMAKAYAALEKKQSQGNTEDTSENTEGGDDNTIETPAGTLDITPFSDEFAEHGELSDASYESLAKAGIPREMVDAYIDGLEAQATIYESQVRSTVGDDAAYDAMIEWAKTNLNADEIEEFDQAVGSNNINKATAAVKGLHARMQVSQGVPPERTLDGKGGSPVDVYESVAQMEADMNDPRYQSDPAFRDQVYAKIGRSPKLN